MNLEKLTREDILTKRIPLTDLLKDSVYYPASHLDGRPIEYCNTHWRDMDVNSFVYCDFNTKEEDVIRDIGNVNGYSVLADRSLSADEYIPEDFCLELPGRDNGHYFNTFIGRGIACPYAHWVVFERKPHKDRFHGPERFSLLFIGGEGLATFQQLYCHNHIAPKMICFIQCWGMAGNWTDFTAPENSFHRTILRHKECLPQWMCMGYHDTVTGVVRLKDLTGDIILKDYISLRTLQRCFGDSLIKVMEKGETKVYTFLDGGRKCLALSIHHCMGYAVYDITDCYWDLDAMMDHLKLKGIDRYLGMRFIPFS